MLLRRTISLRIFQLFPKNSLPYNRDVYKRQPKIKAIRPEASYLVWLDCRELKLSQKDLNEFFVDKAHLALNDGEMFGKEGIGFMRLNVASPRCIIEKAMKQLADAYQLYIK